MNANDSRGSMEQKRWIWVTGATSGIGRALSKRLSENGHMVLISGRNEGVLKEMEVSHANMRAIPFDVTESEAIERVRSSISGYTDRLNAVYVNAGNCEYLDLACPDWSMAKRIMDVNYLGAVNTLAVAMPLLHRQAFEFEQSDRKASSDKPHIVGISSLAMLVPFSKAEVYGASKAALSYFLKSLRMDLRASHIDVTEVLPGFVTTPLTSKNTFNMPFVMSAEEAALRIVQGVRSRPRTFAFPKRLFWLLRLWSHLPALWERLMSPKNITPVN